MSRDSILLLGCGFIGHALARRLSAQGRRVHIISRTPARLINDAGAMIHQGDLSDAALLNKLRPECATVIHLATVSTPGASAGRPTLELENLLPALRMLEAMHGWSDTHLIYLSSGGTVYGNPTRNPVTEDAPLAPLSYYGAGKVAMEGFMHALGTHGCQVTILRPANAYGPRQGLQQGFGLIRTVLQHILQDTPLEIWGDGQNVRDFVYVDDVVDAIMLAVNAPADRGTYNVGSGQGHSIKDVLATAQRVSGKPLRVNFHPARSLDVRAVVLDNSRIASVLGWRPGVVLEEGIHRTWQWLQQEP